MGMMLNDDFNTKFTISHFNVYHQKHQTNEHSPRVVDDMTWRHWLLVGEFCKGRFRRCDLDAHNNYDVIRTARFDACVMKRQQTPNRRTDVFVNF